MVQINYRRFLPNIIFRLHENIYVGSEETRVYVDHKGLVMWQPAFTSDFKCQVRTLPMNKGSEHTDLFGLTGAIKTFNSCEDFHSGFHASLCGKNILLCKALMRADVICVLMKRLQMCMFLFCFVLFLHLLN